MRQTIKILNLVSFFREAAKRWTIESRCGECYEFGAPLSVQAMNNVIPADGKECCVHMFLTRYSNNTTETRNGTTQLVNGRTCFHNFELRVVKTMNSVGTMIDNEIPNYEEGSGLYDLILSDLLACFGCGMEFDLCEMGYDFNITKWTLEPIVYEQDMNWTGWKIDATFAQPQPNY